MRSSCTDTKKYAVMWPACFITNSLSKHKECILMWAKDVVYILECDRIDYPVCPKQFSAARQDFVFHLLN